MDIKIEKLVPKFLPLLNETRQGKMRESFNIPDYWLEKIVAVINELTERQFEYEKNIEDESFYKKDRIIKFPLYPFPFFIVESFKNGKVKERKELYEHMETWSSVPSEISSSERRDIIEFLNKASTLWLEDSLRKPKIRLRINLQRILKLKDLLLTQKGNFAKKKVGFDKRTLYISKKSGIQCNYEDKNFSYPITKKRYDIVRKLKDGITSGNILSMAQNRPLSIIIKEIGLINKIFQKKLNTKDKLIIHSETGGYELNRKSFNIKFAD